MRRRLVEEAAPRRAGRARRRRRARRRTIKMRRLYARALCEDATLDNIREAVDTLEDVDRIARRVLGDAHPIVVHIEKHLRKSRGALRESRCPSGALVLAVAVATIAWVWRG